MPNSRREAILTLRAATIDEKTRSVEAVLATETPARVFDWDTLRVVEEVLVSDGAVLPDQVPLLENHQRYSLDNVLGSVRGMKRAPGEIMGRLVLAEGDTRADSAWLKIRQGHLTDVSVGYNVLESVQIKANSKAVVNGREWTAGPQGLRVTTKWQLKEASLVPIGADVEAKIRADAEADAQRKENTDMDDKETKQVEVKRADPPVVKPAEVVDLAAVRAEAIKAERERVAEIRKLAGDKTTPALVQRAIDDGWDGARAAREFLADLQEKQEKAINVISRSNEPDVDLLSAGLMLRVGLPVYNPKASEGERKVQERLADLGRKFRDMTLLDVCRAALTLDGKTVPHGRTDIIRAAVSTASLGTIFTTSINAQLMQSYTEAPDTTSGWVREVDVSNFQSQERHSLGKTGALARLPRGGTAKHATIGDETETYAIARYANQFVIDDQDIVDDNLGALMDMPREMGFAAARLRPDLVYSILLANAALSDSVALFSVATHANLTTAAFAKAALEAAITAMGKKTMDGVRLNIRPRFVIVPGDIEFEARTLLTSGQIIITGSTDTLTGNRNVIADLGFELRVDGRLDASGVTDPSTGTAYAGSATNWFLAADPAVARTIEVGYLAGTGRVPQLRSFVLDKGTWGIGWDIKHDIGAKALDYRGLHKSTGAA